MSPSLLFSHFSLHFLPYVLSFSSSSCPPRLSSFLSLHMLSAQGKKGGTGKDEWSSLSSFATFCYTKSNYTCRRTEETIYFQGDDKRDKGGEEGEIKLWKEVTTEMKKERRRRKTSCITLALRSQSSYQCVSFSLNEIHSNVVLSMVKLVLTFTVFLIDLQQQWMRWEIHSRDLLMFNMLTGRVKINIQYVCRSSGFQLELTICYLLLTDCFVFFIGSSLITHFRF